MINLTKICNDAVAVGDAEKVAENVIVFVGKIDTDKFDEVRGSYLKAFDELREARQVKENMAEMQLQDYAVTY